MHFPREHPNPQHIPAAKPLPVQVTPPKARPRHELRAARGWCGPAQQGGAWRAGHQMRGDFGGCTFRTYRSGPTGGPGPAMSFALCSQGGGGVKGEQRPYPTEGGEMTTKSKFWFKAGFWVGGAYQRLPSPYQNWTVYSAAFGICPTELKQLAFGASFWR